MQILHHCQKIDANKVPKDDSTKMHKCLVGYGGIEIKQSGKTIKLLIFSILLLKYWIVFYYSPYSLTLLIKIIQFCY